MERSEVCNVNKKDDVNVSKQHNNRQIIIGADSQLSITDAYLLSRHPLPISLHSHASPLMKSAYQFLKLHVDKRIPIYGINTNFGDQVRYVDTAIKDMSELHYYDAINARQSNILKSLSCGLGDIVDPAIVRVTMMLRAHCLAKGYSGIHPDLVDAILAFIKADIIPVVRCYGSIGASGDLIPLSMIAAAIMGENVAVHYQNKMMMAGDAIKLAGLTAYCPVMRDGLAMINGTSFMTAIASLSIYNLNRLFKQMLSTIAMSLESLQVISSAYHPSVHRLKRHSGEYLVNQYIIDFWQDSRLLTDHDELKVTDGLRKPIQDYYSIRSVPQGFGPFHENLERSITAIENEMNCVNDNPIIDVANDTIHHSANFMGYYVTDACDILKMNIAQASTWLHALLANMVHPRKSNDLPINLVENPAKQNGFRSMQLLSAALAIQNRKLAQSHQAYTLPTEGDNQDVSSLGTHAALDLQESVANLERLTAILLLAATQALELRGISKASSKAQHIYHIIRSHSPTINHCRPMSDEIALVITLLQDEMI